METAVAANARDRETVSRQPRFSGLSHVSLACRDLAESKLFYSGVLGGELVHEIPGFVEYRIADAIFGLSEQNQGWTAPQHEYPHYAFYLDGPNFERMIRWLDGYSVPNYPYRRDPTALVYFRDPSGNLFELYCDTGYDKIASLPPAPRRGGPPIDFRSLNYQWTGRLSRADSAAMQKPQFSGFAHASLYCRDLAQAKRFFTTVMICTWFCSGLMPALISIRRKLRSTPGAAPRRRRFTMVKSPRCGCKSLRTTRNQ